MGLALSPSGTRIGVIALGKLWVVPIGGEPPAFGEPRAVAEVPHTAHGLAWSPDETEIAFAAGPLELEDLYAVDIASGEMRRVTSARWWRAGAALVAGRRAPGVRARDARRLPPARRSTRMVTTVVRRGGDCGSRRDLRPRGSARPPTRPPGARTRARSSSGSSPTPSSARGAEIVSLSGERRRLEHFADAPIFLQWPAPNAIVFARHDRLWTAEFDSLRRRRR